MKSKEKEIEAGKQTNLFDFLIAFGSGLVNLLKVEKILCIIILYLLVRDGIFVSKLSKDMDYTPYLIDTKVIEKIFESDNTVIIILGAAVIVLACIIVVLIIAIQCVYKKEIQRLVDERKEILHDAEIGQFTALKKKNVSGRIEAH